MRVVKVLGSLLLVLILAVVLMYALGSRLPHAHTATASAVIDAPQAKVWQLIADVQSQPSWRPGLKSVAVLPPQSGHPCWIETQSFGNMPLCEVAAIPPSLRVVHITDPSLPFGGGWVYQLNAISPDQTSVTIKEDGTTGPAIWRFLGHYVFHEDTTIKQYLRALQKAAKP